MTGTGLHFPFQDPQEAGLAAEFSQHRGRFLIPVMLHGRTKARLVCGYEEIRALLGSDSFSRAAAVSHAMTARSAESLALNSADPPDHARRRGTVTAAFTRARSEMERAWIGRTAEDLLLAMMATGPPADLIRSFSLPLSVAAICRFLGVSAADFSVFGPLTDVMMSTSGHTPGEISAAHREMFGYFSRLYDMECRRLRSDDERNGVMTDLVNAAGKGTVTRTEAIHIACGLLMAGYETTSKQIAITVSLLLSDRSRWERTLHHPSGLQLAIEETLRWTSLISTGGIPHLAVEDTTIAGTDVRAGEVLIPVFAAANRDPRTFDEPDRLCLDRKAAPHVAFGHGRHLCLGAPLARVELQEALAALIRLVPGLELDVPPQSLRWREGAFIRGPRTVPVRW
jgi:cytochrome P450